ncbi:MAG: O-antigen ligase family protein [Gammaproteobacteria bacterium]|nr:O-antigen ligase family protein [Gammaproteobacteria bacterium]
MTESRVGTAPSPSTGVRHSRFLLTSFVFLAQALVARAYYFEADFVHVLWGALLLLAAAGIALRELQVSSDRRSELPFLGVALAAALWLGFVQFGSVAPARGLYSTWVWWSALCLVPVARIAWRNGWAGALLFALLTPGAVVAAWHSWEALQSVYGYWAVELDPNILADRLALMTFLLMLGWAFAQASMLRIGAWLPVVAAALLGGWVVFVAIALQQGLEARAIMLALPVGILAVGLALKQPWMTMLALLVVLVFGLAGLDPDRFHFGASTSLADIDRFRGSSAESAFSQRFGLWGVAWQLLAQGWATGTGLNSFAVIYPPLRPPTDRSDGTFVHNDWLQLAFEAGLPFVLLLLCVLGVFLVAFLTLARRRWASERPPWDLQIGLVSGVMAGLILVHAIINFPLYDPTLLNIVVASLVICCSAAQQPASHRCPEVAVRSSAPGRWWSGVFAAAAILLWLPAVAHGLTWAVLREHDLLPGRLAIRLTDEQHFVWSDRLRSFGLGHGVPSFMQASWAAQLYFHAEGETRAQLAEQAVAGFNEARSAQPWQADFDIAYVRFLAATGRIDLRVRQRLLEEALERNPLAPGLWLELARQLDAAGRWEQEAGALVPQWLEYCVYMTTRDQQDTESFFNMIPRALLVDSPQVSRCRSFVEYPFTQRILDRRR